MRKHSPMRILALAAALLASGAPQPAAAQTAAAPPAAGGVITQRLTFVPLAKLPSNSIGATIWAREIETVKKTGELDAVKMYSSTFKDGNRTILLSVMSGLGIGCNAYASNDVNAEETAPTCPAKVAIIKDRNIVIASTVNDVCFDYGQESNDSANYTAVSYNSVTAELKIQTVNHGKIDVKSYNNGKPDLWCSDTVKVPR